MPVPVQITPGGRPGRPLRPRSQRAVARSPVSFSGPPSRIRELRGMLQRGELRVDVTARRARGPPERAAITSTPSTSKPPTCTRRPASARAGRGAEPHPGDAAPPGRAPPAGALRPLAGGPGRPGHARAARPCWCAGRRRCSTAPGRSPPCPIPLAVPTDRAADAAATSWPGRCRWCTSWKADRCRSRRRWCRSASRCSRRQKIYECRRADPLPLPGQLPPAAAARRRRTRRPTDAACPGPASAEPPRSSPTST